MPKYTILHCHIQERQSTDKANDSTHTVLEQEFENPNCPRWGGY